ncbi:MAG TPA: carboxypeptidase-like regulatory domain-containing protein [Planctomycetota bacterium]|nr:carboxypeptidase-like regulatory domain-containing protein [Planctomycetota bacterium]
MRARGGLAVGVVCGAAAIWWFASRSESGLERADSNAALVQGSSFDAAETVAQRAGDAVVRGGATLSASAFDDPESRLPTTPPAPPRPGTERRLVEVVFPDGVPLAGMRAWPRAAADGPERWSRFTDDMSDDVVLDARGRAYVDVPAGAAFRMAGEYLPDPRFVDRTDFVSDPSSTSAGVERCVVASTAVRVKVVDEAGAASEGLTLAASGRPTDEERGCLTTITDADGVAVFRNWRGTPVVVGLARPTQPAAASAGNEDTHVVTAATGDVTRRLLMSDPGTTGKAWLDSPYCLRASSFEVRPDGAVTFVVRALPRVVGRVEDEAGRPIAGAQCAIRAQFEDGRTRIVSGASSDREGRFVLPVPRDARVLALDGTPPLRVTAQWVERERFAAEWRREEFHAGVALDGPVDGVVDVGVLRPRREKCSLRVVDTSGAAVEEFDVVMHDDRAKGSVDLERLPDGGVAFQAPPDGFDVSVAKDGYLPELLPRLASSKDGRRFEKEMRVVLRREPRLLVRIPEQVVGGRVFLHDPDDFVDEPPSIPPATPGAARTVTLEPPAGEAVDMRVSDVRVATGDGETPCVASSIRFEAFRAEELRVVDLPCPASFVVISVEATRADGAPASAATCVIRQGEREARFALDADGRGRCAVASDGTCLVAVQKELLQAVATVEPRASVVALRLPPSREVLVPEGDWTLSAGAAWLDSSDCRDADGNDAPRRVAAPLDAAVRFVSEDVDAAIRVIEAPGGGRPPQSGVLAVVAPGRLVYGHLHVVVEGPVIRRLRLKQRPSTEPYRPPPMTLPSGRYRVTAYRCHDWTFYAPGVLLGSQVVDVVEGGAVECVF